VILLRSRSFGLLAGLMLPALFASADEPDGVVRLHARQPAGVVRISDGISKTAYRGQSEDESATAVPASHTVTEYSGTEYPGATNCPDMAACPPVTVGPVHDAGLPWQVLAWIHNDMAKKEAWISGKFGHHFENDAGIGFGHDARERGRYGVCAGAPLAGHYSIAYPVDPSYFDRRDGQVYAAAGYGGPVSVPLAPVVNHAYNYGWGIPSSRLTPVLHPVTQTPMSMVPRPSPATPVAY
jgi:hypothetical protein